MQLILHGGDALSAARFRDAGIAVRAVEMDLFVASERSRAWMNVVNEAGSSSNPMWVSSRLNDALEIVDEVMIDVKCPTGSEEHGVDAVEAMLSVLETETAKRISVISRNHALAARVAPTVRSGPIISDGLVNLETYLSALGALAVVISPLGVTRETCVSLARARVQTVMFPATSGERLEEAAAVGPAAVMIEPHFEDLRLLKEVVLA